MKRTGPIRRMPLAVRNESSRLAGFTLLEVVLALGLSSLLLAAVYAALQMHWTSSSLGQVEMERSQLARAIFKKIEIDLRSVIFQSTPLASSSSASSSTSTSSSTTGSTSSGSSGTGGTSTGTGSGTSGGSSSTTSGSSSTSGLTVGTSDSGETTSTQKSGLFGDSQTLVVHCSLPSQVNPTAATSSNTSQSNALPMMPSDLQSVAYFLRGSSSTLAQQLSSGVLSQSERTGGLCRMQGDRAAMQIADEAGDLSSLAANTKMLAKEVANISFEFFDGVSWTTSWDSGSSGTLPNAVRITIDFAPPEKSQSGWFARTPSTSTDRFSHTVAMPLAEPYVDQGL